MRRRTRIGCTSHSFAASVSKFGDWNDAPKKTQSERRGVGTSRKRGRNEVQACQALALVGKQAQRLLLLLN